MATLREVAAEANVSQSTVSKVLNRVHDAHIPDTTKERVRAAARRVGYHPSAIARGLAGKRMNSLGLIMAYDQASVTTDPYLGACLDGVLKVAKERRQKTVLFTEDDWEEAIRHVPAYCDGHCDGLMLVIPRTDSRIVAELTARRDARRGGIPFVLVGDSRDDDGLVCVDVDNVSAARHAVAYLLALGHRRIAALCGNADFLSSGQRLEGYRRALADAGICYDPELVLPGEYWPGHGRSNAALLLDRFSGVRAAARPTALFCFNDNIAHGALDELAARGVSVPEEMSVVGFDDVPSSAARTPALTTVRQSVRAVGELAAHTLLACVAGEVGPGHRAYAPTELIVRGTTAPPADFSGRLNTKE